jgi:hypothetical protein
MGQIELEKSLENERGGCLRENNLKGCWWKKKRRPTREDNKETVGKRRKRRVNGRERR